MSRNVTPTASMKQAKVAAGMIAGTRNADIAAAVGVSERQVKRLKQSPEVIAIVAYFFEQYAKEIAELQRLSIIAVRETLQAGMAITDKKTKTTLYLADHRARMAAVQRVQAWQEMSRPKKEIPVVATIPLEELERRVKTGQ